MSQAQCVVHDAVTGSIDDDNSKEPDKKAKSRRPASMPELSRLLDRCGDREIIADLFPDAQILPSGSND